MESETRKGPIAKGQKGKFQVAAWRNKKKVEAKNRFDVERDVETVRASVQYGRFNRETETWENDVIWCYPSELEDLAQALEELKMKTDTKETSLDKGPEHAGEDLQE